MFKNRAEILPGITRSEEMHVARGTWGAGVSWVTWGPVISSAACHKCLDFSHVSISETIVRLAGVFDNT